MLDRRERKLNLVTRESQPVMMPDSRLGLAVCEG